MTLILLTIIRLFSNKNTVSTDKCIQNEFSSLSSSKSFRRNDIKNEGSLDSENNQDASDKINSRLSIEGVLY